MAHALGIAGRPMRLIKGRAFVVPRSGGRLLLCLQCVTGTVYEMELHPPQVEAFLDELELALTWRGGFISFASCEWL
jgi:hypothetical protein